MSEDSTQQTAAHTTSLARKWVIKMAVFLVVLIGFGIYGLYDAIIAYPNRGEASASWHLHQYLLKANEARLLESDLGVPDGMTASEHKADLEERLNDLTQTAAGNSFRAREAAADIARYHWLNSLGVLGRLTEERVVSDISDRPNDKLAELDAEWSNTTEQPKPLASYDIPVQWAFVVVGLGGGGLLLLHMMRTASRKYTWDPSEMRLGLPGGVSIVPDDVEVFDRRKWDKFLVFLKIKSEHPQLGGKEVKLDLYQYEPLEEWYLAMHRHARPEDLIDEDEHEGDDGDESDTESEIQESEQHPRPEPTGS
ncbi:MAG: hypothetical protein ED559_12535 [Phycisphaera sp.]|nr:MAG: hypothetical protein ED559_12535 [Phycisphaera sp.]